MSSDPEGPSPPPQSELSPDRCPSCGRPLKFPDNRPEGLCAACGIYVEILKPLPLSVTPPLDRTALQTLHKRDLIRTCQERGLDPSGTKEDLVRRLLEHVDEPPQGPPEAAGSSGRPQGLPEATPQVEDVATRRERALFHLNLERSLKGPEEPPAPVTHPEPSPPAREETPSPPPALVAGPPPPSLPSAPSSSPPPLPGPPPPPIAPEETPPLSAEAEANFTREFDELFADEEPAAPESPPEPPASHEEEAVAQESPPEPPVPPEEEAAAQESPPEPPGPPEEEPVESVESGGPGILELARGEPLSSGAEEAEAIDEGDAVSLHLRRDRIVFYAGLATILFGGVGLLFGSFIHDLLRVPMFGRAFEVFGPFNVTVAALGGGFVLAGLCAVAFAFRGGIVRARPAPGA